MLAVDVMDVDLAVVGAVKVDVVVVDMVMVDVIEDIVVEVDAGVVVDEDYLINNLVLFGTYNRWILIIDHEGQLLDFLDHTVHG